VLTELNYFYGKPTVTGQYKQQYEDFIVTEDLGFELTGDGEHVLVYLQKRDCNTIFVAEQLAKYVGISAKLVSYAGLKDRQAVTRQWFSLHMPGQATPDFSDFNLDGCEILKITRHNKKLKIGALKGNYFDITLKMLSDKSGIETKLALIKENGVPIILANSVLVANKIISLKLSNGQMARFPLKIVKNAVFTFQQHVVRFLMILSVNELHENLHRTALDGDILQLAGRGSWFVAKTEELDLLQHRLENREITITAPMLGDSPLGTMSQALEFEQNCLKNWTIFLELFKKERIETARRSIVVYPLELNWQWLNDNSLTMRFYLPSGCYATSVIRELIIGNE